MFAFACPSVCGMNWLCGITHIDAGTKRILHPLCSSIEVGVGVGSLLSAGRNQGL